MGRRAETRAYLGEVPTMCRFRLVLTLGVGCLVFWTGCVKPPPGYPTGETPTGAPPAQVGEAVNVPEAQPVPPAEEATGAEAEEGLPEEEISAVAPGEVPTPVTESEQEPQATARAEGEESGAATEWEGVVGSEAPPAETRAAARARRVARLQRPRPAADRVRPTPAPAPKKPTPPPPPDPVWDRIAEHDWGPHGRFPWASELELTTGVLARFSNKDLSIMAMEILARRGKPFGEPGWRRYFDKQSWYYPQGGYSEAWLGPIERGNYRLIRDYQRERFGAAWEPPSGWGG